MKEFQYTVKDACGIHARPAGLLVKVAKGFASTATLEKGGKTCDLRKLMALMGMGVKQGDTVTIKVEGDDEAACAEAGVKALVGKIATGDLFVGDSETKAAIEAKCAPDCVEMEGAAVSQIAAKNGVPCVILRAMSDNADEDGHEVLVVKKFSISEYVATATKIVAAMVEKL